MSSYLTIPPGKARLQVLPGYSIQFDPEPYIVLVLGALLNAPCAKFAHPNLMGKRYVVHDFKHYAKNSGRKWWTRHAGVDFYLMVPKAAIQVVSENGYSYPKVVVGGKEFQLNVSGGTGGDGWLDWIGTRAATSVNLPVATLKAVASCAMNVEQGRATGLRLVFKPLEDGDRNYLAAAHAAPVARRQLRPGQTIQLTQPYECFDGNTVALRQSPSGQSLICTASRGTYRLKADQVDWVATCRLNDIAAPTMDDAFNRLAPEPGAQLTPEPDRQFTDLVMALCAEPEVVPSGGLPPETLAQLPLVL